ncbi:MAG TPA: histidinol dehydrogenase [Solirubrobacteraceae bacterium]|jgi:histidinol dehydrogenase|nr:histidinol dehydrogenase [Solirubrobacteraceae bacterium]
MRVERFRLEDPDALVGQVRDLIPAGESVAAAAGAIVDDVRDRGDAAVIEYTDRFDVPGTDLRVGPDELAAALAGLDEAVRRGLEVAISNVAEVANAGVGEDREVLLAQGHRVLLREVAVRRAAVYVPGGAAPYPSTVVMGVVTARSAGVEEVVICTPPPVAPVLLATCALCGIDVVYRIGGAQAVAALAYGTETVGAVDVIVGPGNLYVQEAKRLVSGQVGIDGFAGPSDLLVIFDAGDLGSLRLIGLDLLAQAEHGAQSLVLAVSDDPSLLDALAVELTSLAELRPRRDSAPCVLVEADSLDAALAFSDAYAPEHLELIGPGAEALASRVRCAGAVFVGWPGATAFGDYVAGSNHVLPTGGSARFASSLSPRHFRRRMAEIRIPAGALAPLAQAGAAIALAEGFPVHAESMLARAPELGENPAG